MDLKLEQRFVEWNRPFCNWTSRVSETHCIVFKNYLVCCLIEYSRTKKMFCQMMKWWWNLKSTLIKQKRLTLVEEWLWSLLQVKLLIISNWVAPNKTARSQTGYVKVFLTCDVNQVTNIKIIWKLFELETRQLITRPCDIMLLLDAI